MLKLVEAEGDKAKEARTKFETAEREFLAWQIHVEATGEVTKVPERV